MSIDADGSRTRDLRLERPACCRYTTASVGSLSIRSQSPAGILRHPYELNSERKESNLRPPGPKPGALACLRYTPSSTRMDSNHRLRPYQRRALTVLSYGSPLSKPVHHCVTAQDGIEPPPPDSKSSRLPLPHRAMRMDSLRITIRAYSLGPIPTGRAGFEPAAVALTVRRSTVELPTNHLPGMDSNHHLPDQNRTGCPCPTRHSWTCSLVKEPVRGSRAHSLSVLRQWYENPSPRNKKTAPNATSGAVLRIQRETSIFSTLVSEDPLTSVACVTYDLPVSSFLRMPCSLRSALCVWMSRSNAHRPEVLGICQGIPVRVRFGRFCPDPA